MKRCTTCGIEKPLDGFGKHKAGLHGKRAVCRPCNAAANREYVKRNPDKVRATVRNSRLKGEYGITTAQFEALLRQQGGACAICRRRVTRLLHIDHCHRTGRVRGLLCFACNTSLGFLDDDVERLRAAIEYLEASNG